MLESPLGELCHRLCGQLQTARRVVQGDRGQQAECKRVQAACGREPLAWRQG